MPIRVVLKAGVAGRSAHRALLEKHVTAVLLAERALATRTEALVVPALAQGFAVPRGPRADLTELRATLLLRLHVLPTPFSSALGAALILVVALVMLPLYATSGALFSPSGRMEWRLIPSGLYVDPTWRKAAAAPK